VANAKDIRITGHMPFDAFDKQPLGRMIGQLVGPACGLKVVTSSEPTKFVRNSHGGKTAFYSLSICGVEACSHAYLQNLLQALFDAGCEIQRAEYLDPEDAKSWPTMLDIPVQGQNRIPVSFEIITGIKQKRDTLAWPWILEAVTNAHKSILKEMDGVPGFGTVEIINSQVGNPED
jgi:hypothetical protein